MKCTQKYIWILCLLLLTILSIGLVQGAYSQKELVVGSGGSSSSADYDSDVVIDIAGESSSGNYNNQLGFFSATSAAVDEVIIVEEISFVNYTNTHSFNVTAGAQHTAPLENITLTIDSGTCIGTLNVSSGDYTNATFTCTGTPYSLANISIEFCISTACAATQTASNDYPNRAPSAPTLLTPTDGNLTIHDVTPLFNWTDSTDIENDDINYTWTIDTNAFCVLPNDATVNESNFTPSTQLCPDALEVYYWNVTACDAWDCNSSETFNFTLEPYVEIVFVNDVVDFGVLNISQTANTSDDSPAPFHLRNQGNVPSELVNVSTVSSIWSSASGGFGSSNWQTRAREVIGEENSFNSSTQTTYIPVESSLTGFIAGLNHSDSSDEVYIDYLIIVPEDEPAGSKSATVTFSWGVNP